MDESIRCLLSFCVCHEDGSDRSEKEGAAVLYADRLTLDSGDMESIDLLDILRIECKDYRIGLILPGGQSRELFNLGFQYEIFSQALFHHWNEAIIKALLMQEKQLEVFPDAVFSYSRDGKTEEACGECDLRLYETALVLVPKSAKMIRIPYCFLSSCDLADYKITIKTELDATLKLTRMGFLFDPFMVKLHQAIDELSGKMRGVQKELLPGCTEAELHRLSDLMKDGKAVLRTDLEEVSETLWEEVLALLDRMGMGDSYRFLAGWNEGFCDLHAEAVGLKQGLMGELTGVYLWLLIPIIPYNILAMEAAGAEGGKATYFFRLIEPGAPAGLPAGAPAGKPSGTPDNSIGGWEPDLFCLRKQLLEMNDSLLAINFRREPIYLTEEQLTSDAYAKYRYSIANIPGLKSLRMKYLGRVIHTDKWEENVTQLIDRGKETSVK